ncbi:MAG TPA: hypothetical protein ENI67_02930 [Gammaproteobacteria bacterium]|nr:hypothetical protein [Gammaproteobacteria bacterium]
MKRLNLNKMVYVFFAAVLTLTTGVMSSIAYADNPSVATKNPCSPTTGHMGNEKQIKNSGNPCAVKKGTEEMKTTKGVKNPCAVKEDTKGIKNPCATQKDTKSIIRNPCGGM